MTTFNQVAFLRAMNVGGRRVTNDQLCETLRAAGFETVIACQASGNLLLSGDQPIENQRIEAALSAGLGFDVPTMVRSASDIHRVSQAAPFSLQQLAKSSGKVQVMFLDHLLDEAESKIITDAVTDSDLLVLDGTEVYWLPTSGISDSPLKVAALNKLVGPLTVRTQGTVARIAKKL